MKFYVFLVKAFLCLKFEVLKQTHNELEDLKQWDRIGCVQIDFYIYEKELEENRDVKMEVQLGQFQFAEDSLLVCTENVNKD